MRDKAHELVEVGLGARSYPIHIGAGLLARAGEIIAPILGRRCCVIVTDENVAGYHLDGLQNSLRRAGIETDVIVVTPGEPSKCFDQLALLCDDLLVAGVERQDKVIALGGGVIGDLCGFAAAILRRGVDFIQIPTTLLAQVDSAVGGKTGINSKLGKNLIGAFHQPKMVLADIDVLATLPRREFLAGYAEVVKYGLIGDQEFFAWLEENGAALIEGDLSKRQYAVYKSCTAKAALVTRDETEQGVRALLNLGHTFGHALEAAVRYDSARLVHGEAVAVGMALAFRLSAQMGLCTADDAGRAAAHLEGVGLPVSLKPLAGHLPDAAGLITLMGQDKKVVAGQLTFILARGIGNAFISREVGLEILEDFLDQELAA